MGSSEAVKTLAGRVDERAWSCVLGWDAQIADVAEGVLALAGREESVEMLVVGIELWRCALRRRQAELGLQVRRRLVVDDRVGIGGCGRELGRGAFFGEGVEGWRPGRRCRPLDLAAVGERVVRACGHRLQSVRGLVLRPWIVAARCGQALLGLRLLYLRNRLLLGEHVRSIWVVGVEGRLLRLHGRLRLEEVVLLTVRILIKGRWLSLETVGVSIRHAGGLIGEAGGLRILVVQVARGQRLLRVDWIAKPVHRTLLLVTLVVTGGLRLRGEAIIKERLGVAFLQFSFAKVLFFSAELDRLGQILVLLRGHRLLRPSFSLLFRLRLTRLDSQTILRILIVRTPTLASFHSRRRLIAETLEVIEAAHTGLP